MTWEQAAAALAVVASLLTALTVSLWVHYLCRRRRVRLSVDAEWARAVIHELPSIKVAKPANHSHGDAARTRNAGVHAAGLLARQLGLDLYIYQMSQKDQRAGRQGSRKYFWTRDLVMEERKLRIPHDCVLYICDVIDHMEYAQINKLFASHRGPIVISTFVASQAAAARKDYSYRFDANNGLDYFVSGNARFNERNGYQPLGVWDWSYDTLTFDWVDGWGRKTTTLYNVEQKELPGPDHRLVCLVPAIRVISSCCEGLPRLASTKLRRFQPVTTVVKDGKVSGVVFVRNMTDHRVSISTLGSFTSVELSARGYDELRALHTNNGNHLSAGMIASAKPGGQEISRNEGQLLLEAIRIVQPVEGVYISDPGRSTFKVNFEEPDATDKFLMREYAQPFIGGGINFARNAGTMRDAVDGRIVGIRVDAEIEKVEIKPEVIEAIADYLVEEFSPWRATLVPTDLEQVRARRMRRTQRLNDAREDGADCAAGGFKTFAKAEAYHVDGDVIEKITNPRVISPQGSAATCEYARYTHATDEVFEDKRWYAPGNTPRIVAGRVAKLCSGARFVANVDASRMDGRKGFHARVLWQMFLVFVFKREHHAGAAAAYRSTFAAKARGPSYDDEPGLGYWTGWAQNSGAMDTTPSNSLLSDFEAWWARRLAGLDTRTGRIICGDDMVLADVPAQIIISVGAKMGQVLEVDTVARGELGVNFLNRWYGYGVWDGALDSICNTRRALSKLHMSVGKPEEPLVYFATKCEAYRLSDANSPALGEIVNAVTKRFPKLIRKDQLAEYGGWNAQYDRSEQYPNACGDWALEYHSKWFSHFDYEALFKWVETLDENSALRAPLLNHCEPGAARAWLDGEMPEGKTAVRPFDLMQDDEVRSRMTAAADALVAIRTTGNASEWIRQLRAAVLAQPKRGRWKPTEAQLLAVGPLLCAQ